MDGGEEYQEEVEYLTAKEMKYILGGVNVKNPNFSSRKF